jgi:hypothetical protein
MSWVPTEDPTQGDKRDCSALDLIIEPHVRDLGDGFSVRRSLPHGKRQMVGPFIFFDQMGPVTFGAGRGLDVRPHPHIGLATVTYLFQGKITHRDSLGNALDITPGAMNLMTAGRGIVHSERSPQVERQGNGSLYGIQSWIALPKDKEEIAPSFEHFDAGQLPIIEDGKVWARVIAGSAFGKMSPVGMQSPWFYVEVVLKAGGEVPLEADYEERGIYIVEGEIEIAGKSFSGPNLLVFKAGDRIAVKSASGARLMFLGGAPMDGHRHIWWNFVSSSQERLEQAKADWKAGRFPTVPGETEFIPLPEK